MMRILTKIFLLALTFGLSACMHNDGDIGPMFGTWKVTSITVDGEEDPAYQGNVFFQFQSQVVRLVQSLPHNDMTEQFGSWECSDDDLTLDFHYYVDPESPVYSIPAVTRLEKGVNRFAFNMQNPRKMTWILLGREQTIVYTLIKQ